MMHQQNQKYLLTTALHGKHYSCEIQCIRGLPELATLSRAYTEYSVCDTVPPYRKSTLKVLILKTTSQNRNAQ